MSTPPRGRAHRPFDDLARQLLEKIHPKNNGNNKRGADNLDDILTRDRIGADVWVILQTLRAHYKLERPLQGYRADNVAAANKIRRRIEDAREELLNAPANLLLLIFTYSWEVPPDNDEFYSLAVQEKIKARIENTLKLLAGLSTRCGEISAAPPGKHRHLQHIEEMVAKETWDLLERHGRKPTNSSSETSLYRVATGMMYELLTGRKGVDLAGACRNIAERRKPRKIKRKASIRGEPR